MVKSKLKLAVFIEGIDKYKNILELVNRLDKNLIEVDVYSLKLFNSKYSFNLYFRRRKFLFHKIYKSYDVVIALGVDKDVIKYAINTNANLKILFSYDEKIKKYPNGVIFEFDSLEELRKFEPGFLSNTKIMKEITEYFNCKENELSNFLLKENNENHFSFSFICQNKKYEYLLKIKEKESSIELYGF